MIAVYKYPFTGQGFIDLYLPEGAEILSIQIRDGSPCMWAKVDTDRMKEQRRFIVSGTGQSLGGYGNLAFIGTFQEPPYFLV